MLLRSMGANRIHDPILSLNTDVLPARDDQSALEAAKALAETLHKKEEKL